MSLDMFLDKIQEVGAPALEKALRSCRLQRLEPNLAFP